MEELIIKEVLTKKILNDFIYLPENVHKGEPAWLPPIYMDEKLLYDKKKNKSFNYADAVLYVAYRGKKPVGRIMGLINNRYNAINNENDGRFAFMESYNDQEVVHILITKVEDWLKEKGIKTVVGPLAFSDKDPQGFQIEGFEYPQFITSPTNSPYMPELIANEGYEKKVDLVNYLGKLPEVFPPVYEKVLARFANSDKNYKIIEFTSKKELRPYIVPALQLMNDTFSEIYGFVQLNEKEQRDFAARYLPILDPNFVKLAEVDGKLVGFAVGMPDVSDGIRLAHGRMLPFGIFKILKESKRSKKLLMMLGGVKKAYRGQGIEVLMGVKIIQSGIKRKMDKLDSHLVLENNTRMRAEYERVGCQVVKKFRIYQKAL
ncbi:MAG TPA: hypothetical protein PLR88_09095 [Bacteroidales bacterium]|nr:hypothetical protein [Bacteroidales bacterium]HPT22086.1 hypothetical protein [Bacteroidales bacterium]